MLLCISEEDEDPATKFELLIQLGGHAALKLAVCVVDPVWIHCAAPPTQLSDSIKEQALRLLSQALSSMQGADHMGLCTRLRSGARKR